MNSQEQSKQNKESKPRTEEERRREQAQERQGSKPIERKSDRPESDGEDFNQGGASRSRTEATGEDF